MSIVKRHLAEQEERLVLIEEICIDTGALVLGRSLLLCRQSGLQKRVRPVFQAWAKGTVKGTTDKYSKPQNLFLRTRDAASTKRQLTPQTNVELKKHAVCL
jgi:hypothetical protein